MILGPNMTLKHQKQSKAKELLLPLLTTSKKGNDIHVKKENREIQDQ